MYQKVEKACHNNDVDFKILYTEFKEHIDRPQSGFFLLMLTKSNKICLRRRTH